MSLELRTAAAIAVVLALMLASFLVGASYRSSGDRCVSATLPGGLVAVECARDLPALGEF